MNAEPGGDVVPAEAGLVQVGDVGGGDGKAGAAGGPGRLAGGDESAADPVAGDAVAVGYRLHGDASSVERDQFVDVTHAGSLGDPRTTSRGRVAGCCDEQSDSA